LSGGTKHRSLEYKDQGDEQKTEKNGGIFQGTPGPKRDCSAIDGMKVSNFCCHTFEPCTPIILINFKFKTFTIPEMTLIHEFLSTSKHHY
jgi:hypothetical protein